MVFQMHERDAFVLTLPEVLSPSPRDTEIGWGGGPTLQLVQPEQLRFPLASSGGALLSQVEAPGAGNPLQPPEGGRHLAWFPRGPIPASGHRSGAI